jgi:hypothetical protein
MNAADTAGVSPAPLSPFFTQQEQPEGEQDMPCLRSTRAQAAFEQILHELERKSDESIRAQMEAD